MKDLKNKILPYVPFAAYSRDLRNYCEKEEETKFPSNNYLRNVLYSIITGITFLISGAIYLEQGSLNPAKWSEIQKQREIQQELKTQNSYRNQFHELDKNKDYVVDSTEFIYRK